MSQIVSVAIVIHYVQGARALHTVRTDDLRTYYKEALGVKLTFSEAEDLESPGLHPRDYQKAICHLSGIGSCPDGVPFAPLGLRFA